MKLLVVKKFKKTGGCMSMNKFKAMRKRNVFSGVPAALVLCVATALSANVHASSYAVATNSITNFGMTFSPSTSFTGFTFSSDTAAQGNTGTGNAATMDAAASCIGCSYNNSFMAHGMVSDYSYGDAQITNNNVLLGTGSASVIGESSVSNGVGSGSGINTMVGYFSVTAPTTVNFGFDATPYLQSQITAGGLASVANINMTVTISNMLTNQTVFSWAPNGSLDAGETADAFNLNWGLGLVNTGNAVFNPGSGHFASSANLAAIGPYSLNITMNNSAFVSAVPVPAAAWLLGSGLIGLVGIARRKVS
ncbi:VPLPA-CTERM sorting domain-containing protein [Sulfuricella denitrificans]|nr:VPLPA-CTERM sorting domain-containing protein [Sulfuricella denitrificans]